MSDSNKTAYQIFRETAAAMAPMGLTWWHDEVLFRSSPDGTVAGIHVVCGLQMIDVAGNPTRLTKGPYPIDTTDIDGDLGQILGGMLSAQQATIAARDATIAAQQQTIANLQAQLAAATAAQEQPAPEAPTE